jgi:FG-GAP repeat/RTX calcium-binding nonapeptide repeat (4 copies)
MLIDDLVAARGFRVNGLGAGDQLGYSVRAAGDVNRDGYADLIIGAPFADAVAKSGDNGVNNGAAFVIFGGANQSGTFSLGALNGTNGFRMNGQQNGNAGLSAAGAGDINGDGFADLIMGSPNAGQSTGDGFPGALYILLGRSSFSGLYEFNQFGGATSYDRVIGVNEFGVSTRNLGTFVGTAGDMNGDGIAEFTAGSTGSFSEASEIQLTASFNYSQFRWTLTDPNSRGAAVSTGQYGPVITGVGDVNADGLSDVIVDTGVESATLVYGRAGNGTNMPQTGAALNGSNSTSLSGNGTWTSGALTAAGDFNGDGVADFLAGDALIFGRAGGFGASLDVTTLNGVNGFRITGVSVGSASSGDFNGDGLADLIIGSSSADPDGRVDAGSVFLLYGRAGTWGATVNVTTLDSSAGLRIDGTAAGDGLGFSVAGVGDLNNDGVGDFVIGAAAADAGGADSGAAYVIYGIRNFVPTQFFGTAGNDTVTGDAAANELFGLGGDDVLRGLGGADVLDGGTGFDIASYAGGPGAVFVRLDTGVGQYWEAEGDRLRGIEGLIGTSFGDILTGDAMGNFLSGGDGADAIYGLGGADTLIGGFGGDQMFGGDGVDTVTYAGNFGGVWIDLPSGVGRWNFAEGDVIGGVENVIGTDFTDWLTGDGNNNRLESGLGDDRLVGGAGNDVLNGGFGGDLLDGGLDVDTVTYFGEFGGVWINMETGVGKWNSAEGDTLTGIDKVIGTAFTDWFESATNRTDFFTGEASNDLFIFQAGFGQDVITDFNGLGAGAGDVIRFGAGTFTDFADVMSKAVQQGNDVVITLNAANVLTLQNSNRSGLSADDFIFDGAAPQSSAAAEPTVTARSSLDPAACQYHCGPEIFDLRSSDTATDLAALDGVLPNSLPLLVAPPADFAFV